MDWQKNRLAVAAALFAALLGGTVYLLKKRDADGDAAPAAERSPLPTVSRDAIAEVSITRPGQPAIRLVKQGAVFRVAAPVEAAADATAVDAVLEKLTTLEFVTVAATNTSNHAVLEVDDLHAIHVVAKGAGGNALVDLRIGAYRGGNTMIRVNGANDVLAVRGSIKYAFNKEVREFRDRTILDTDASDVRAVSFVSDQGTFRFERNASDEWVQAAGERPIERFSASKVDGIVSAVSRLRASDFAAPVAETGLAAPRSTITLAIRHAAAEDGGTPTNEEVVLTLGAELGGGNTDAYVGKRGTDVVFTVSGYMVERLRPALAAFQADLPPPDGGAPEAPPAMPPSGGGEPLQLPPELMQQLMQQATQMGGHP